jgi:hypothetical protein
LKETKLARNYSFEKKKDGVSWDDMSSDDKLMLYRPYQELTLFVSWSDSVDKTFLPPKINQQVKVLTDENKEVKKMRMEAFMQVYMELVDKELVANHGTLWHRHNQYLHSMWLSNKVNKSVRENRADNDGVFSSKFAPGNVDQHLLDESNAAVYKFGDHDAPLYDMPEKGLKFELSAHLEQLSHQKPSTTYTSSVATPLSGRNSSLGTGKNKRTASSRTHPPQQSPLPT